MRVSSCNRQDLLMLNTRHQSAVARNRNSFSLFLRRTAITPEILNGPGIDIESSPVFHIRVSCDCLESPRVIRAIAPCPWHSKAEGAEPEGALG